MASLERRPSSINLGELRCFTWNIAAINNNPFEYYATFEDEPGYEKLMLEVQHFIDTPGERDVAVSEVFTPAMFERLKEAMSEQSWEGIDKVEEIWQNDLAPRPIISKFLCDKELGSKRLASMPDRMTNTINNDDGTRSYRPTIINNYQETMETLDDWFDRWHQFMFKTQVSVKNKAGEIESKTVCNLLRKIPHSKYPALSEEEEAISIPLQVLACAIFDAILVHIMNATAAATGIKWQDIKVRLCNALVVHKQQNVLKVLLEQAAPTADVIFLQEVAGAFVEAFQQSGLGSRFMLLAPKSVDHVRDQNSLILVCKDRVASELAEELSLTPFLGEDVHVADGDICVFAVSLKLGGSTRKCILSSFHGDTAGLQSTPVVSAVRQVAEDRSFPLIFGLDANTHALDESGKTKNVDEFLIDLKVGSMPLHHSWEGETSSWHTTFNARTYLQPQLNKAVRYDERHGSKLTDSNPKDFILFSQDAFEVSVPAARDNTGSGKFVEGMDIPSLTFPSDHALVSTTLRWNITDAQTAKCCTIS